MTPEGYFLDCWPAFDRLARVAQKQIDGAYWGPLGLNRFRLPAGQTHTLQIPASDR